MKRLFTANHFVAIPDILISRSGILDISFTSMRQRSHVELHGTEEEPLLQPMVKMNGRGIDLSRAEWQLERHWIPSFNLNEGALRVYSRIFAPLAHRGFVWVLELYSNSDETLDIDVGWRSLWRDTYYVVNSPKPMKGDRFGCISERPEKVAWLEFRGTSPLFALSFCPCEPMEVSVSSERDPGRGVTDCSQKEVLARDDEGVRTTLSRRIKLAPGGHESVALYVGLGLEETSAVTSALDLKHRGWEGLLSNLSAWLDARRLNVQDEQIGRTLNLNVLYNYFFSQAVALDTEEAILVSARSSTYPTSAAYLDRNAMRWSLPAVLSIGPAQARKMIEYAYTIQLANVGIHSRFIDGVVLEPGFQLDELCAPIRALNLYVRATRDVSILFDRRVQAGVNRIRQILSGTKHPSITLFETLLAPSGDVAKYPYVTYDNVLVWRSLRDLAWMYELIHDLDRSEENKELAQQVMRAVLDHCIVDGPFGPMFAFAVDLEGNFDLRDDPAGSLQLLSWLEFCPADHPAYRNTVRWIHSPENPHSFHDAPFAAPGLHCENHPSVLSVANDLLTGRTEIAIDFLRRAELDDGIACETVDEHTGRALSGGAFASCAGYLAFALTAALGTKILGPEPEPTDRLYEPPPPEIRESIESARL